MSAITAGITPSLIKGDVARHVVLPSSSRTISIAYTPDSDDAFNFYAWEHGRIRLDGCKPEFHREHVFALNKAAATEKYDIVGISSVAFPTVADRYWILSAGNSIGRGYGPVLVSKHFDSLNDLHGKTVAVAGIATTGGALAMMYCPAARFLEMPYDQIANAIVSGEADAGVMIHEELLFFPQKGLRRVADLGAVWCDDTGYPLPVGLNVVRHALGRELARDMAFMCRESLRWAHDHYDEAFAFASKFGRGCAADHVRMFSNADTLVLAPEVRQGIRTMFDRVAMLGIAPRVESFEVIDG